MEPSVKKLRPYQVRLVTDVCRATEDVLVEQPTGSGKTVQIVTLVAMHLGERFTHAVISAPQEQIEQGFVKRDYQVIAFPDCPGVAVPSIQVPKAADQGGAGKQTRFREAGHPLSPPTGTTRPRLCVYPRGAEPAHAGGSARRPLRQGPVHRRGPPRLGRWSVADRHALARARRPIVLLHGHSLSRRWPAGQARRHARVPPLPGGTHGGRVCPQAPRKRNRGPRPTGRRDHGRPVHRRRGPAEFLFRWVGCGDLPQVGGGWQTQGDCPRAADAGRTQRGTGQPSDASPRCRRVPGFSMPPEPARRTSSGS